MTPIGHNERTQAIVEHMQRRSETHRETKLELPPGLQSILQTLADEIDGLKAADKATRDEIAALKSALVEACSHLKDAA
jgi:hypothetical protein